MEASKTGNVDQIKACTRAGGDINHDSDFSTLMYAAQNGHEQAVRFLIAQKANVNPVSGDGVSALQLAAFHGHLTVCEVLLKAGADKHMKSYRKTAAQWAAQKGHKELAEFIESWGQVCFCIVLFDLVLRAGR